MTEPSSRSVSPPRSEEQIRESVRSIIVDLAPKSDGRSDPAARLVEDLGYHSLALMEITFALEDEFDLEPIDQETASKIRTVGQVQDLVIDQIRARGD